MCIVQVPWLDSADNDSLFICIRCLYRAASRTAPHRTAPSSERYAQATRPSCQASQAPRPHARSQSHTGFSPTRNNQIPRTTQPSAPAVRGLDRLMLRSLGFRCDKPATPHWPAGQAALSAAPRSLFPLAALGRAEIMLVRAIGRLPGLLARNRGKRGGGGGGGDGGT